MEQEKRHELVDALADVIVGLQVPYSIEKRMLGTAGPAWLRVWQLLDLTGWQDKQTLRTHMAAALLDK